MKKITDFLFSTRLMSIVVVLFFVAMAVATFVENDYGTQAAKALIYNSWWFEFLMYLLTINFIGNIFKYKLYRRKKWPVLLFHIAFIITLLGSFVTRYIGFEGMMPIREGNVSNTILSEHTYVEVFVQKDNKELKGYDKKVLLGVLNNNDFTIKGNYFGERFDVDFVNYIPNVKSVFKKNPEGTNHLHIVVSSYNGRQDIYLKDKTVQQYNDQLFSLNKPTIGAMNFMEKGGELYFQPASDGTYMQMQTQEKTPILKDSIAALHYKKLYSFSTMGFVITERPIKGEFKQISAPVSEKGKYAYDALYLNITSGEEKQLVILHGAKNAVTDPEKTSVNGLNFTVKYGSKEIKAPFSIKLRDFQLERYPGSRSPSSYASEVTVMDIDSTFDYRIFMNNVLDYKGYRFFQSSYDPDEGGTVLSVNHDYWGTLLTYIGYFLMALGMFVSMFWNGTRFMDLSKRLKKLSKKKLSIFILLFGLSSLSFGQEDPVSNIHKYKVSKAHADKFGRLLIQDFKGRVKPINTYAIESLRKIYKKDSYDGLSAEQVILGAQLDPRSWSKIPLIHVKTARLGSKTATALKVKDGLTSYSNFLKENRYFLNKDVNTAHQKKFSDKTGTDKELINLDERFNVWERVLNGSMLRIYPSTIDQNNKWFAGVDKKGLVAQDTMMLKVHKMYLYLLKEAVKTNNYEDVDLFLENISNTQRNLGASIIPSKERIDLEIAYNKQNIFKKLMFYYMIIGFIFLILAFVELFNPNSKLLKRLLQVFSFLTVLGMLTHIYGMGVRWNVSGHAPWSNAYEAVVFIAFVTTLAGLLFSHKKSKFTLSSTVLFASFLLAIAHGSMMSPEITNLVPVLKSYWLQIHVAVITASYGFVGLGALLGFVVLLLYIIRTPENAKRLNHTIDELTYVNESAITVGLYTLSIGTFLGGVWAAESWGRYWSWDPKEVWSLISMMVYVFVLHMRLVPGLKGKFAFNLASLFSFSTMIMTFFGVNFYLSGMHSYATGDPVPIPTWIYFAVVLLVLFSVFSYLRYYKFKTNKKKK